MMVKLILTVQRRAKLTFNIEFVNRPNVQLEDFGNIALIEPQEAKETRYEAIYDDIQVPELLNIA
jgi:hypothetical protein